MHMLDPIERARRTFMARRDEQKEACSESAVDIMPEWSAFKCLSAAQRADSEAFKYAWALYASGQKGVLTEAFTRSAFVCSISQLERPALVSRTVVLPVAFKCAVAQHRVVRLAREELEMQSKDVSISARR